jgi:hypothetical protein
MSQHVWKEIKGNPNLYSWVPISKKVLNDKNKISIEDVNVQDIPSMEIPIGFEDVMFNISEDIDNKKKRLLLKNIKKRKSIGNESMNEGNGDNNESNDESIKQAIDDNSLVSVDDPEKYSIVKDFIIRKGLKLYGGAGINMYLPKKDKIYNPYDIPDYDFYSTDPWNDAVELADIFYEKGYKYAEARAGIHKGTYKVFVNMWPVADITYMNKEDFDKIKTKKINGMNVVSPFKLLESIYKEFSNPYSNPSRYPKIAVREKLLLNNVKELNKKVKCSKDLFKGGIDKVDSELEKLMKESYDFSKKKKLLFAGSLAYNTYIEIGGGDKRLLLKGYTVLSENAESDVKELFTLLLKINSQLEITTKYLPAKDLNYISYTILRREDKVCEVCVLTSCIPYKKLFGIYVVGIDYVKYDILFKIVFGDEEEVKDGKCMLKYLNLIQEGYYKDKKITEVDKSPFQRFLTVCKGPVYHPLKVEILNRWLQKESEKKDVLKEYEGGYKIKKYPIKPVPEECKSKSKDECTYPCAWNKYIGRCSGIPLGIYRAGVDSDDLYDVYDFMD